MNKEEISKEYLKQINNISKQISKEVTIMEVCGGHTNTIMKYGIRDVLPKNINLISGPGCPVCVSSQYDIDCMIELGKKGIPIATYGDMLKVPGSKYSLEDIKVDGAKIFEIYSTTEVLELKKQYENIVFFGIGFETTAPMTAYLLENNICVYSVHKTMPEAMKALISGEIRIDGFIDPGHVSAIIGEDAYKDIKVCQAISGFEPQQILLAIKDLLQLIKEDKKIVFNSYKNVVTKEGNLKAQNLLEKQFKISDAEWRGLGIIPGSGLEVRNDELNAKLKYKEILEEVEQPKKTGCRCGEILKGLIKPIDCPLYKKVCTPENPEGACMVSDEGTCAIYYRYDE